MKRIASLFLILLLTFALTACGPSEPIKDSDSLTVTDPIIDPPISRRPKEMMGQEYIILQTRNREFPFEYPIASREAEFARNRIEEVRRLYNSEILLEQIPEDGIAEELQRRTFTDSRGDILFCTDNSLLRGVVNADPEKSLLVDLLPLDNQLNLFDKEKWGGAAALESMMAGGHFYGVTPALWFGCAPKPVSVLLYDKDLLHEYDVPDLPEYLEKDQWDRDVMLTTITNVYSDSAEKPVWGITAPLTRMIRSTLLAVGADDVRIGKINGDGTAEWEYGPASDDGEEALTWLRKTLKQYKRSFNHGADDWEEDNVLNPFLQKRCGVCLTSCDAVPELAAARNKNFGLMPWAGKQSGFYDQDYDNCCSVSIPVCAQNPEWSALLMWDLFEAPGSMGPTEIRNRNQLFEYYRTTYFSNDFEAQLYLPEKPSGHYSYAPEGGIAGWETIRAGILSDVPIRSLIDRCKADAADVIETYVLPNRTALASYRQAGLSD